MSCARPVAGARRTSRSPDADERRDALALALADGVGVRRHRELLARFGSPSHALDAAIGSDARRATIARADAALAATERLGARLLRPQDADYPPAVRDLPDAPPFLWALGHPSAAAAPCIAIVGTRDATDYGLRVAQELAAALARAGASVVSGLARGVDAAAHRAALDVGGRTVAVLGTGIDRAYPAGHRALQARIGEHGLLLSEFPPGAPPTPGCFPRRNRIIAALGVATIVVEAGVKSGALGTAGHALDLGRTVAAVPGRIDAPESAGTNALLRDGATVVADQADALLLAGLSTPPAASPPLLDGPGRLLWDALAAGPLDLDTLAARTSLPVRECTAAVTALELAGLLEPTLGGELRRR